MGRSIVVLRPKQGTPVSLSPRRKPYDRRVDELISIYLGIRLSKVSHTGMCGLVQAYRVLLLAHFPRPVHLPVLPYSMLWFDTGRVMTPDRVWTIPARASPPAAPYRPPSSRKVVLNHHSLYSSHPKTACVSLSGLAPRVTCFE